MSSFSSLFTSLTGAGFYYEKNPRHATYNFSQDGLALYKNQPRLPFEYYVNIRLNNAAGPYGAAAYIKDYFNTAVWDQVAPLIKTVDMPSMKIETTPINQYNRKRISQTKITFEPVKMVFHDVADGKTLKFWEMYYRYYFGDGTEPGQNDPKSEPAKKSPVSVEDFIKNITPTFNPNITGLGSSIKNMILNPSGNNKSSPNNTNGIKSQINDIVSDTLDNHNFGFNLPTVQNVRNLIQQIDIYQVHGGRFNQVTLVNPRISTFSHDVLNYAAGDKTLELTFVFEYEYAYYTIQNLQLKDTAKNVGLEKWNNSSIDPFTHGEFLEIPSLAFNATLMDFVESNNPLLNSDNPILNRVGKNVQSSLGNVTGAAASTVSRKASASVLNGLAKISPTPYHPKSDPVIQTRPLKSTASPTTTSYKDINRTAGR